MSNVSARMSSYTNNKIYTAFSEDVFEPCLQYLHCAGKCIPIVTMLEGFSAHFESFSVESLHLLPLDFFYNRVMQEEGCVLDCPCDWL